MWRGNAYSLLFCIFLAIDAKARKEGIGIKLVCDFDEINCIDLEEKINALRSTTTTKAPRSYSADQFAASDDGTISCKAVRDCPKLSEEEILFKWQMEGLYGTDGKGCRVTCNHAINVCSSWCPGSKASGGVTLRFGTALTGVGPLSCGQKCRLGCPPTLPCRWKKNVCRRPFRRNGKLIC
eukprot:GFUD01044496.1.p1 GENE.GFUD01044496.1~~GFUD01044496.1.p1  ORF type:complete len:181 (+),score=17.34 GFUD01044496.1:31-573(+)